MPDFIAFINICQEQLKPLLPIKDIHQLVNFNQKIKDFAVGINFLFFKEWTGWKQKNAGAVSVEEIKASASKLLMVIDNYQINIENQEIIIFFNNFYKRYPLVDPFFFVKDNLYSQENIYFYILLGELLIDENFDYLQLYSVYLKMNALSDSALKSDKEQSET